MKQKDIALILIIAFFVGVFAFLLSSYLISPASKRHDKVETVEAISPEFNEPDKRFFNEDSVNPTQTIRIGDQAGTQAQQPAQ